MSKTIMAVGAHTGDAQLTCGMLLAKHAMNGDRVRATILARREKHAREAEVGQANLLLCRSARQPLVLLRHRRRCRDSVVLPYHRLAAGGHEPTNHR